MSNDDDGVLEETSTAAAVGGAAPPPAAGGEQGDGSSASSATGNSNKSKRRKVSSSSSAASTGRRGSSGRSSSSRKRKNLEEVVDEDDTANGAEEEEDEDDDRISPRSVAAAATGGGRQEEDTEEQEEEEDQEEAKGGGGDDRKDSDEDNLAESADEGEEGAVEEEAVATATSTIRRAINKPGRPPEAGVIDRIYAENFMCHQKMSIDLNRQVNFIHGQNGSGKSAILHAIQICLGAGARRTHRARNLKNLIKDGEDRSKIRITLLNGGEDGYRQDVYGNKITIERTITTGSGYNGYKLLDENGAEKSRSKKDLDEMLDRLNVQVDNPVSVLDQEESKKFLCGKAEDKYAFFMKATELERIDRNFANTLATAEEMNSALENLEQALKQQAGDTKALKKKYEEHQQLDKLQNKVRIQQVKLSWAQYQETEEQYQEVKKVRYRFVASVLFGPVLATDTLLICPTFALFAFLIE